MTVGREKAGQVSADTTAKERRYWQLCRTDCRHLPGDLSVTWYRRLERRIVLSGADLGRGLANTGWLTCRNLRAYKGFLAGGRNRGVDRLMGPVRESRKANKR
jgi:hypothetical protein